MSVKKTEFLVGMKPKKTQKTFFNKYGNIEEVPGASADKTYNKIIEYSK